MSKESEAFKEACEIAAMQRNAVTVPEDKLLELQRKAKAVDELRAVNALIMEELTDQVRVIGNLETQIDELLAALVLARSMLEESEQCYENQMFRNAQIDAAIAKAKGE